MKKVAFMSAMAAMLMLASCDSKTKLTEQIEGEWSSTPEQIVNTPGTQGSVVRVFDFERTPGKSEGTVTMKALVTVSNAVPAGGDVNAPISVSASGVATITGKYTAMDDDDIAVALDYSTMSVAVDPEAVSLNYNVMTQENAPDMETLKPAAVQMVTQQISDAANVVFANVTKIEDIHVKGALMMCEIDHRDYTLRKAE